MPRHTQITQYRTTQQNARLHKLLTDLRMDAEAKRDMVSQFTDGRTESSSQMYSAECQRLIDYLQQQANQAQSQQAQSSDLMRKKIIGFFRKKGHVSANGKTDMQAVHNWCVKHGYLHKPLNQYTYQELPTLVTQAERMYQSFLKAISNE
jgi:hypothetical protein